MVSLRIRNNSVSSVIRVDGVYTFTKSPAHWILHMQRHMTSLHWIFNMQRHMTSLHWIFNMQRHMRSSHWCSICNDIWGHCTEYSICNDTWCHCMEYSICNDIWGHRTDAPYAEIKLLPNHLRAESCNYQISTGRKFPGTGCCWLDTAAHCDINSMLCVT